MSMDQEGWAYAQRVFDQQKLTRLAYLAGFFDGEGYIIICRDKTSTGRLNYRLRMGANQVTVEPINLLKQEFGGLIQKSVRTNPKHRDIYSWQQHSQKAVVALNSLLPYLVVKREQAEFAIEWVAANRGFKGKLKTETDLAWLESQKDILHNMKGKL